MTTRLFVVLVFTSSNSSTVKVIYILETQHYEVQARFARAENGAAPEVAGLVHFSWSWGDQGKRHPEWCS